MMNSRTVLLKLKEILNFETNFPLVESGQTECGKVEVKFLCTQGNNNGSGCLYKFDESNIHPYFKAGSSKVLADYLYFYDYNGKLYCIIFNLKSKNLSNSNQQVHAMYLFSKFIISSAVRCINIERDDIPSFVEFRAYTFCTSVKNFDSSKKVKYFTTQYGLKQLILSCKHVFYINYYL